MEDFLNDWGIAGAVFLPLIGALLIMAIPRAEETLIKAVALLTSLVVGAIGIAMISEFSVDRADQFQFVQNRVWIEVIESRFHVGIDGISLPLILLTMLIVPLCIIYSWNHFPEPHNPKAFLALILILETGMIGTFVALDLILFFVFFEVVLLPMFFMIAVWGGENRRYASLKFFLFTLFGSALMILSFLALYFLADPHTFDMTQLPTAVQGIALSTQIWIFLGMFMGFGIKVPMFPFHTWLPDAHTQAPTVGSVILAAVLLKLGTYGFVRIAIPILPAAAVKVAPLIGVLAVIGIIYGALGCLAQTDMKRLIAFSSVAHMGFVMLGISTLTNFGINAAVFGMVAHGIITGMLFFIAGSVKERYHTLEIKRLGGLLIDAPKLGWILGFCVMASLGLPGLAGFWGEFPAILASYSPANGLSVELWRVFMVIAALGTVFAAGYLLWLLQRTAFGTPKPQIDDEGHEHHEHIHDIHVSEAIAWAPLLVLIVVLGIYPNLVFKPTDKAVSAQLGQHECLVAESGPDCAELADADKCARGLNVIGSVLAAWELQPHIDWAALAPEIVVTAGALLIILLDSIFLERFKPYVSIVAGGTLLGAMIPVIYLADDGVDRVMFGGAFVVDNFALVLQALFLLSGYIVVLLSTNYIAEGDYWESEYYALIVSSLLGMLVMASARDLITMFVALELLSIPAYMLATWRKRDPRSNEAGLKYYLMGVFASAIMLYGMSLLFGVTGSTLFTDIAASIGEGDKPDAVVILGVIFVVIGFAFKVSAFPFHTWAPDTYEGAPTPVTAFLAVASKTAGFVALLQLVFVAFEGRSDIYEPLMWVLAAGSMTAGNLIALRQTNIVRLMAYSGIAEAGYMLAPLVVAGHGVESADRALESIVTYLVIYAAMNLGAFAVILAVARKTRSAELDSYRGLFSYAPGLTVAMTIFLFSLAGIPPLGGWFGKFQIIRALLSASTPSGVIMGVVVGVNSVIALFYYASIARRMWADPVPDGDTTPIRVPASLVGALVITVAVTIMFGVFPQTVGHFTEGSSLLALGG